MAARGWKGAAWLALCACAISVAMPAVAGGPLPPITRGLAAFWAFQEPPGAPRVDSVHGYLLQEDVGAAGGTVARGAGFGKFGPYAAVIRSGQRFVAERSTVPAIASIGGVNATVSVVAWIAPEEAHGFVAGCWNEAEAAREFGIFLDGTAGCEPRHAMVAHISGHGAPEDGRQYCGSAACGNTPLPSGEWACVANVYDGESIHAYLNGSLDTGAPPDKRNPLKYPDPANGFPVGGIYVPPAGQGADFAVGHNIIHDGGGVGPGVAGNKYTGSVGGVAVYNRALTAAEVRELCW